MAFLGNPVLGGGAVVAPDLVGQVDRQCDFLFVDVAAGQDERGLVLLALALEDQDRVEGAGEAKGAADLVHGVGAGGFRGVVDDNEGGLAAVGHALDVGGEAVVGGVGVVLAQAVGADAAEGVD